MMSALPSSARKTLGLSVTLFTSRSSTPRTQPSASRVAPCTCGMQRREYASCTFPQSLWLSMISLSVKSARRFSATVACPG